MALPSVTNPPARSIIGVDTDTYHSRIQFSRVPSILYKWHTFVSRRLLDSIKEISQHAHIIVV
eukprot:7654696-Pyramimonas_sp.AAC.1